MRRARMNACGRGACAHAYLTCMQAYGICLHAYLDACVYGCVCKVCIYP